MTVKVDTAALKASVKQVKDLIAKHGLPKGTDVEALKKSREAWLAKKAAWDAEDAAGGSAASKEATAKAKQAMDNLAAAQAKMEECGKAANDYRAMLDAKNAKRLKPPTTA